MLSLDEAIKHAEEVAELNEECARIYNEHGDTIASCSCYECAKEHRQLAEWLKELKYYKDRQDLINKNWQELIMYKEGIKKKLKRR